MIIRNIQPVWAPDAEAGAADVKVEVEVADKGGSSFLANADDPNLDEGKTVVAPADWPEDWRDKLSGGDANLRKRADRFKAPNDILKSYDELERKFKKGGGAAISDEPMPDAEKDPEGVKAWREARGIPADPTGYVIPDAVKDLVTDADKPLISAFTEDMHKAGVPAAAVGPTMTWYFKQQDAALQTTIAKDKELNEALQEELRSEWGSEFRPNSIMAKRMGEKLFGELAWSEARLPDGRRLGDIPEMTRALAAAANLEFGDVAFAGGDAAAKTVARETEIREIMRNDFDRYDNDPAMKAEFQQITEAKQKRDARS